MENESDKNKILENNYNEEYEFKFNFINKPWDDRTLKSKIGIISLLVAIFVATFSCVVHNFYMHFKYSSSVAPTVEIKCHLVKMDENKFVARIHSVETQELLCVGAMVSARSVLANGVCARSGPVRLRLGSHSDHRCKKGFAVDMVEPIVHEAVVSKHLVLLTSYENMAECGEIIRIGENLDIKTDAYILGRPLHSGRSFSRQPAKLIDQDKEKVAATSKNTNGKFTICATHLARCPVRAGDLLIQNKNLFGLASTSTHITDQSKTACFADLRAIHRDLKDIDTDIKVILK